MKALIDADILRYEVGFASEVGWASLTDGILEIPPWLYVEDMLHARIEQIVHGAEATDYTLYLTKGSTFRYEIAKTKPYKGQRVEKKPWHFSNLTSYMIHMLPTVVVEGIEADDAMAIDQTKQDKEYIICSRDKDLRQVPGWIYSWELGNQPSFGPYKVDKQGTLVYSQGRLTGTGYAFFAAQMLMGDRADNIPGIPGWGPKTTYEYLSDLEECGEFSDAIERIYRDVIKSEWEDYMLEQGQLLWLVRRINEELPELWRPGLYA